MQLFLVKGTGTYWNKRKCDLNPGNVRVFDADVEENSDVTANVIYEYVMIFAKLHLHQH